MNLLLDTNVFIDFIGRKRPHFEAAERIVAAGYFGDAKLWVPAQSLKDAFHVLEKYVESERIQEAFIHAFQIITPVSLSGDDAVRAARLRWKDYEDCLIAVAAEKVKADYLITRDKKGFDRSAVPVLSPEEWLSLMERERSCSYGAVTLA